MNAKKVASFAVGPIGGAALGFITLPIITWFYSAEDIGRIAMLQVVSSFCVLLFSLGLDQAYVRDYHESGHKPALFKAALLPGLLLLVMCLAFFLLVPGFISQALFSVDSPLISTLVALCWSAAFVSRFLSLILRMQERGLAFSMSQVLPKLLFLSVIGIYILFSFSFDLLSLVIAQALSVATVTLVYGWNTRQEWLAAFSQKVDTEKLKSMLSFGAPLIMGGAAFWGLTAMDKVFLRSLSSFEELGIYSVASSFAAAAVILQSIFSTVWAPTVYKWAAEGINTEKIDQVTEYVLVAVVSLFSLAGLFSWIITYFLPPSYASVQYILVACMAYPLFYTLSEATGVGLGIARKSSYAMMASIVAVLVNFVGNYLLVPTYGAAGAAISTAFAFWVFFFCRTEFSCRVWRPVPRFRFYATTLVCLVISVLFVLIGHNFYLEFVVAWLLLLLISGAASKKLIKAVLVRLMKSGSAT
ncbi:polysaccharide biosynthesis protein [Pseudomonas sp. A46]|nr:oligosaccharide flippase family protein [Pseudomonas sp. A46]OWJ90125.1 polysaccharide biosynthesis protein [Pseudomonas sp. A46]